MDRINEQGDKATTIACYGSAIVTLIEKGTYPTINIINMGTSINVICAFRPHSCRPRLLW